VAHSEKISVTVLVFVTVTFEDPSNDTFDEQTVVLTHFLIDDADGRELGITLKECEGEPIGLDDGLADTAKPVLILGESEGEPAGVDDGLTDCTDIGLTL